MNNQPFSNYAEFKELFVREDGSRKNAVLLAFLKAKEARKQIDGYFARRNMRSASANIRSMSELYQACTTMLKRACPYYNIFLMDLALFSNKYATDHLQGVCEDRDTTCVRYINIERDNKVFKMKAGKFFREVIEENSFAKLLPPQVITYLCEEVARNWRAYASSRLPQYTLRVESDYEAFCHIYDSEYYRGSFHSCMTDSDQYSFYADSVDASAAWLEDEDGATLARCIIFNKATNSAGQVMRLAERQYADDDVRKQMLVYALAQKGYIDAYKKVGADCSDSRRFIDAKTNEPLSDNMFSIDCHLEVDDKLSYQDSFKWYDRDSHKAYNYPPSHYTHRLDTTDEYLEGSNYDSYHDTYTNSDLVTVYYDGREYTCAEDDMDCFVWVESEEEYHHLDDCFRCDECNTWGLYSNAYRSDITDEMYCCRDCRDDAEQTYKERYWQWSEYDGDYFEEVETFINEHGDEQTISKDTLEELLDQGTVEDRNGVYVHVDCEE